MPSLPRVLALVLLALPACSSVTGAAVPLVRVHAEKDLDCPGDDVRIEEELGGRYKAVGCGRKAYYRSACDGLTCTVQPEEEGSVPWRDRPTPE
jgi:hypothetical protein